MSVHLTYERFSELIQEMLDRLPDEFRCRVKNVVVLLEDEETPSEQPGTIVLGRYVGTPLTRRSRYAIPGNPDRIIVYQRNIEAVCSDEEEVRVRLWQVVTHEFGHYFGLSEEQLQQTPWLEG